MRGVDATALPALAGANRADGTREGTALMSESRPWFRLYTEFASDPKVQLLDETLQRRFVMLLCLAGAGITPTSDVSQVDFVLRIGVSECERTRSILVSKGLIGDDWFPK